MPNRTQTTSGNVIVLAVTILASVMIVATVALVLFAPEKSVASTVPVLLGFVGTTIATLVTLTKAQAIDQKVEYLANGGMDAKTRAGIADVIKPELLRDDVHQQLEADRAYRAAGPGNRPTQEA